MRISDWSSDVCSSDLRLGYGLGRSSSWQPCGSDGDAQTQHDGHGGASVRDGADRRTAAAARATGRPRGGLAYLPALAGRRRAAIARSEEHTSELPSLMRISYAVFCLKQKKTSINHQITSQQQYHPL